MDATERREKIIRLRNQNPCFTYKNIGLRVGCSQERIRQILVKAQKAGLVQYAANANYYLDRRCKNCDQLMRTSSVFCSPQCRHDYYYISVRCDQCGELREIRKSEYIRQHNTPSHTRQPYSRFFCSRRCLGKWFGTNIGWGRNNKKTHCPQGHPYSGDNLFITKLGSRACRICNRASNARSYKRRKEQQNGC